MLKINGLEPCIICNKKNHSDSLEQLKRIKEYVQRNKKPESQKQKDIKIHVNIASAFMNSTKNHCPYGLHCSALSNMTVQANHIAMDMKDDIVMFIQNADASKLHELLALTQGYFPSAYRTIERYWHKCHNE